MLCQFFVSAPKMLLLNIYFWTRGLVEYVCGEFLAVSIGRRLPVLHSFTKSLEFFLKQRGGVPLSGVTGRRFQIKKERQTFSMK
jgi:hypothetical protein